jgi:hypothetical protein
MKHVGGRNLETMPVPGVDVRTLWRRPSANVPDTLGFLIDNTDFNLCLYGVSCTRRDESGNTGRQESAANPPSKKEPQPQKPRGGQKHYRDTVDTLASGNPDRKFANQNTEKSNN